MRSDFYFLFLLMYVFVNLCLFTTQMVTDNQILKICFTTQMVTDDTKFFIKVIDSSR